MCGSEICGCISGGWAQTGTLQLTLEEDWCSEGGWGRCPTGDSWGMETGGLEGKLRCSCERPNKSPQ